jgi:hypothetical protein
MLMEGTPALLRPHHGLPDRGLGCALVPGQRFLEVCIRFWYPDNRDAHCFLDRPPDSLPALGLGSDLICQCPVQEFDCIERL